MEDERPPSRSTPTHPGPDRSARLSGLIASLLGEDLVQKTLEHIKSETWYTNLSEAEKACLARFFSGKRDNPLTSNLLSRNHQRSDIGAWLVMYHLPTPHLTTHINNLKKYQPDLLTPEQRTSLERMGQIHTVCKNNDKAGYLAYLASLPREEQSATIQSYKQMIIGWMSHPNGSSIYFPFLPAEKSTYPHDTQKEQQERLIKQFPRQQPQLFQLLNTPGYITPPRSKLQHIFHDMVMISALSHYLGNTDLLKKLGQIRADNLVGLISTADYPRESFSNETTCTPWGEKEEKEEPKNTTSQTTPYLTNSYEMLTAMRSAVHELVQDRATLHQTVLLHGTYTAEARKTILERIKKNIILISEKNGRIDLHYFVRHLPSISDNNNFLISDPLEETSKNKKVRYNESSFLLESSLLILSSEWKYALMSAEQFLIHIRKDNNYTYQANTYSGLNNYSKANLQPIRSVGKEDFLVNTTSLKRIIYLLNILPSTSIHITHSRVLKRIHHFFTLNNLLKPQENTVLLIPIYEGIYQEGEGCLTPEKRSKTLEEIRILVHQDAKTKNIETRNYQESFVSPLLQQLSSTEFCYRVTDYLHLLHQEDTKKASAFYQQLLTITTPLQTVHKFFVDQYTRITTPTDGHIG